MLRYVPAIVLLLLLGPAHAGPTATVHHEFVVSLEPAAASVDVHDAIRVPEDLAAGGQIEFALAANLRVLGSAPPIRRTAPSSSSPLVRYRVRLAAGQRVVNVHYRGVLHKPTEDRTEGMPHAFIDSQGAYMDGASAWYPQIRGRLVTFDLEVHTPDNWIAISQGLPQSEAAPGISRWRTNVPQEAIYLIAGRFTSYRRAGPYGEAEVFLRHPAPALAARYLSATRHYVDLYSRLIGPYPFSKFATVENWWETGFGMPSFTLLGPQVMRFPFILSSSFPHEILHSWWGNSVYPDYATGNWSEGLTTYLADYLIQEQRGRGAAYRRAVLQKYADYVDRARDFPLRVFTERHNGASQAVGYGKALMMFHMLRRRLGDHDFIAGLRRFYADYRFRVAGFDDLRRSFERVSGQRLGPFFRQWVDREGAPQLQVRGVAVRSTLGPERYRVTGTLRQTQPDDPYALRVPLALTLSGVPEAQLTRIVMDGRTEEFHIDVTSRPLRLDVDPAFDVFRRLDPRELPPSLGQLFGAANMTVVVPTRAPRGVIEAYRSLAKDWSHYAAVRIVSDADPLPDTGAVWLLGASNARAQTVLRLLQARYAVHVGQTIRLNGRRFPHSGHAFVFAVQTRPGQTVGLVLDTGAASIPALARKLPHYGKYGYLVFVGAGARNVAHGEWPVIDSPLSVQLSPSPQPMGKLPKRRPLIR